ncbi:nitrite reductase heme biosynthesis G protein (plasmid) [Ruegeria pomeroyi DSS-3]|uniref:Siroheme decarboxylase NirG subunit n=2 Tax=Ruegeria pomeroyi TaxID=89184 RepID=Q5LL04_RUEPO|nr:AsnC family transcriptional regulator [Ruegeria pomeroyi]AAV97359.1 nitrite reductase heme biosynthesis G protein [Ruegeria pomeroyi DSS-3]NVK96831.1 AsnC family transcriptional regulator [Ruegeria pomeroyi]NVL02499.1 AsnC family transcriptional regulator [Ruegeria pomeroyi]HCE71636.1 Lrp/AsnC family transcriptional regulator [Ruegeria sp.]
MTPDATDRRILNRMQEDLPLTAHPYAAVAAELGLTEDDLLERLARMKAARLITRFGPFFDAAAMGGAFCLCAMAVPEAEFESVLTKVNAHPEVAHNYERTHRLNMWFVLATETPQGIAATADAIETETGIAVLRFPKLQEFFIGFRVAA